MKFRAQALICAIALAAGEASAQDSKPEFTFGFHGFLGGSLYVQDTGWLGPVNGALAWYVQKEPNEHRLVLGGDVRQSRVNLSLAGPKVLGGVPKGVVELDFFNLNGAGSVGDISLLPRLRVVYAELGLGATVLRAGQDHDLVLGVSPFSAPILPASVGHLANPLSYSGGMVGYRHPGLAVYQKAPGGLELALQVSRPAWRAPLETVACTPSAAGASSGNSACPQVYPDWTNPALSEGEYSGAPAVEARVKFVRGASQLFAAGHWNRVHRAAFDHGANDAGLPKDLDVVAGSAGLKVAAGPLTLQGGGYVGKNLAPLIGTIYQFQNDNVGDIHEWGAWGQIGFNLTDALSAWAFAGTSHPKYQEIIDAKLARLQNTTTSGMLRYLASGWAVGLEYAHWITHTTQFGTNPATNPSFIKAPDGNLEANQLMLSTFYFF